MGLNPQGNWHNDFYTLLLKKKKKKQKKKPQKPTLVFIFFNALEIVGVYLGSVTVIGSLETRDVKGF